MGKHAMGHLSPLSESTNSLSIDCQMTEMFLFLISVFLTSFSEAFSDVISGQNKNVLGIDIYVQYAERIGPSVREVFQESVADPRGAIAP